MNAPTPAEAWRRLTKSRDVATPPRFDTSTLCGLPDPARRFLARVLPPGTPLVDVVVIEMVGQIKIGPRWFPFRAEQVLRPAVGFVWRPVVGGRLVQFVGADLLVDGESRVEFRFHRILPVARATGAEVARSATGRLAGETVLWCPQALAPQAGALWREVDGDRAAVTITAAGESVEIEVAVAENGRLRSICLDRWNASTKPPRSQPFGGAVTAEHVTETGVRVAGVGTGGWDWGTEAWPAGEFFRYRITRYEPGP